MTVSAARWLLCLSIAARAQPGPVLFDFENGFALSSAKTFGAVAALDTKGGSTGLSITPKDGPGWEGVTLAFPARDLSASRGVVMTVRNTGSKSVGVFGHIDEDNAYPNNSGYVRLDPGETDTLLPGVLYLGSRIHVAPEAVWRSAGKYCDVVSHNFYEYALNDTGLPADVDKPILITEFHFGALDRGLPHPGLRTVFNQRQRARLYGGMLDQCLLSSRMVGAHWFQYGDQIYTGRGDGENYQIGFVDICDRPYPEMVAVVRSVSTRLYATRSGVSVPQAIGSPSRKPQASRSLFPRISVDALGRRNRLVSIQ